MKRPAGVVTPLTLAVLCAPLILAPAAPAPAHEGSHNVATTRFAVTPDGSTAFFPGRDHRSVLRVALPTGEVTGAAALPAAVNGVELAPDGKTLAATAPNDNTVIPILTEPMEPGVPIPAGRGPRLPEFTPNGRGLCVVNPRDRAVNELDWEEGRLQGPTQLDQRPFGMTHSAACGCAAVSFPATGEIQILREVGHVPAERFFVGPRPRWMANSASAAGAPPHELPPDTSAFEHTHLTVAPDAPATKDYFLVTSRRADTISFVDTATLEVVHTLDLPNPGNLDAGGAHAFVLLGCGRRVAVVSVDPSDPAFGTVVAVVRLGGTATALRVARDTGVCTVLARNHQRLWAIDPAALPRDGSEVRAAEAIQIR